MTQRSYLKFLHFQHALLNVILVKFCMVLGWEVSHIYLWQQHEAIMHILLHLLKYTYMK